VSEVEAIRGSYSNLLRGAKIVLVVSSGVSLYKSIDTARLLIRHGADVYVFMTPKAARLVSPHLFWWATGNKPVVRLTGAAEHIEICGRADVLLVAATANTLVKLSLGIADNAALTCALAASGAKKVIVPAMNLAMWNTPHVQEAVRRLGKEALVVPPLVEEGKAKYPPPEDVVEYVIDATAPRDYEGLRVLVTAGPTREYLDDVKFITTPSSGLTGYYFAREAAARGAEVTLVTGPTDLKPPSNVAVVKVTSVLEMYQAVIERAKHHDIFIFAAAPLDFYVEKKISGKIDSSLPQYQVTLRQAPKMAQDVKKYNPNAFVIGFKAEYNVDEAELLERTRRRMEKGWNMALAHDVAKMGFGTLKDRYILITKEGTEVLGPAHKRELARTILSVARGQLKRLN
jgi:phosphopantothenoylcysteine decarboxylase/phosphopantothenate--cysteine ligase